MQEEARSPIRFAREDGVAIAVLELDAFDERAHELLVRSLLGAGRRGEAQIAVDRYRERMTELGVQPRDLLDNRPDT